MADVIMADTASPSLNLTAEEKRTFGQLFRQADTDNLGVVTGEVAVKFFEKTRLEPRILGEIWQIADKENRGLLTPAGFGIVLRLIGHYQAGRDPTPELAYRPGPLPKFDGASGIGSSFQPPPGPPPSAIQPQTSGSGPIRVPPLGPDKVSQYSALFEKSGAQNGILPGEQAKQIFERAGLPNEVLGRIWNLADTEQRGALVVTEFVIAMHLLASLKSGALRALPSILPPGLYEAAARKPPPTRQMSSSTTNPAVMSAIPRQFSGPGGPAGRSGSPLGRSAFGTQFSMPGQAPEWAVTPADKARFDSIYTGLDTGNKGYITGEEAVPFFSESKLSEDVLAQIWDLADMNSEGHLNKEEFAVAMYLIRQQRGKRDGRDSLPATLPAQLIPPSMRNQSRRPAQPTAPAFDTAPSLPKSAADDLFGLDALASPQLPSAPTQIPNSTGGSTGFGTDPFSSNRNAPMTPTSTSQGSPIQPQATGFKPFVPSSSFGQSLSYNATGGSNNPGSAQQSKSIATQPSAVEDLLGDNDPEVSKKLTNETAELANLSNQVGTLSTQMQDVQKQRSTSQNELNQATTQKREFEARLSQLRTLYEQEARDVRALEERLTASRNETKKLQQDIAMVEGSYQDLQNQHRQTSAALQSDQQENASLKERMRVMNTEISQLKPQLEKLKSEARQQKGLVAINKKQLSANETERDKLKSEADELVKSNGEQARAAVSSPAQNTPTVASPAPSAMSATNPFFRRQGSTVETPTSPFTHSPSQSQSDRSFENVFGPSFDSANSTGTDQNASATAIRQEPASHDPYSSTTSSGYPVRSSESVNELASPASQSGMPSFRGIPESGEPPAPPESRQLNSSFLPFATERSSSFSSSRQVSAPASRFGDGSTGANTPTNRSATPIGSPTAGQSEPQRAVAPTIDRHLTGSSVTSGTTGLRNDSMPGAFPTETSAMPTPTGGNSVNERADPFVPKELSRAPSSAKEDFDAAFAGFDTSSKMEGKAIGAPKDATTGNFNKEFPPISELENDDDSDSDAENAGGFEDDFTSASPNHAKKPSAGEISSEPGPSTLASAPASVQKAGTNPPTPNDQLSPPAYDKTATSNEQMHSDLDQYSGLLPSRDEPKTTTGIGQPAGTEAIQSPFGKGLESTKPPAAPAAKSAFNDFDDDFDDLEDAKEGDNDDDFSNNDRSGADEFNPMFDSPSAAKQTQHAGHGSNSFSDRADTAFGDFTQTPKPNVAAPPAPANAAGVHGGHDWDAIFAGLDGPTTDLAPKAPESLTNAEVTNGLKSNGLGSGSSNGNGIASTSAGNSDRPQIGRALTEAGEHDDPILKNLTGMGYKRNDALAALEKYDYNLERAANFLASQS